MNSFKVGDKVYYKGMKGRIVGYKLGLSRPYISVNNYWGSVSSDEIKPIKTCYATLGKTGV